MHQKGTQKPAALQNPANTPPVRQQIAAKTDRKRRILLD